MASRFNKVLLAIIGISALMVAPPALSAGGGGGGGGSLPSQSTPSYNPAVEYQSGTNAFRAGDFPTAVRHFRNVISVAPREANAQYLLGASYMGMNDFKKAARSLDAAVRINTNMIDARRDLGISRAKIGEADKALAQLDALKTMQTACNGSCADAAKLADAITQVDTAMAAGKQASVSAPSIMFAEAKMADETYVAAVTLINEKRYEEAIAYLNTARWAAGPHPDILTYLGFANRKLNRYEIAESYYTAALDIAPTHRGALEYFGELKLERGDVAGARANLAKLEAVCGFGCNEAEELRRWIAEKTPSAS